MDLSQAEAVADLINSSSKAAHQIAIQQMRGGITNELKELRGQLLDFAALIELELDFSGEDVEFADRTKFIELVSTISSVLKRLIDSFAFGNAMKNGIPVAIIGEPNVGKSTLLKILSDKVFLHRLLDWMVIDIVTINYMQNLYSKMLDANMSGNIYFPADTSDDVAGAALLGTYSVTFPALST